jgi:hypothetical protein
VLASCSLTVLLRTSRIAVALVFALVAGLYLFELENTPVYFGGDEAHFAVGAQAIAATGRNVNGDLLPVFFNLADPLSGKQQPWGDTWYQPLLHYLTVPFVALMPYTVTTVRLPMAIVGGLVTPLLMYVLARRTIGADLPALVAALIVALAPTQVVLSRQALDYALPLPFVIGWLWCLHTFMQTKEPKHLTLAGLILGIGCYSYIASWAMMPVYLILTLAVATSSGASGISRIVPALLAFAIPVSLGVIWVLAHSEMLEQTVTRYGTTEGPQYPLLVTYFSMFDPVVLFARGGPSLVTSTARSGFVLLPVALLLAAGVFSLWRRRDWLAFVIAAGIITAPIPAAFKGEPSMIQRAMYLLPFLGLLGGFGFAELWRSSSGLARAAAVAAMVLSPLQFGYFYFDYFTHYKFRSAFYYDNVAFRDVAAYVFASPNTPAIYLADDLDDGTVKWRFYTVAANRADLMARTHFVGPKDRPDAPSGSLLVTYDQTERLAMLQSAGWQIEQLIKDVDNRPASVILRKP